MKYLRKFATEAEVDVDASPNVVLVVESGEVKYNVPIYENGVYIQHIEGTLYTNDEWSAKGFANEEANGVAVIADECSFVIAKSFASAAPWASELTLVEGIVTTTSEETARNDFSGKANTEIISPLYENSAAKSAQAYTFPNGQKGYLPSLGEISIAQTHEALIGSSFSLIGVNYTNAQVWSSTQANSLSAWRALLRQVTASYVNKQKKEYGTNVPVRPFGVLNI